jgi:tetratricopeptide (TPR) repeat protein
MNRTLILLPLLLSACASSPTITSPSPKDVALEVAQTEQNKGPDKLTDSLTSELVYNTLTSEIAAQRGEQLMAFEHALQVAQESRDPRSAERATSLGLQANLPDEALTAAKLWIDISPTEIKAYQIAAILNIRANQTHEAIEYLQKVIEIANNSGQSGFLQAAAITEKSSDPNEALAIMQQLIPQQTDSAEALYALAMTANHAKQHDLALEYIDQSLSLAPQSAQTLILKTHTLITMGHQDEGIKFLKQVTEEYPDNSTLRHAYAGTLLDLNQPEDALQQFLKLHNQEPDNSNYTFSLGIISMQLKQFDKAKKYLSELVDDRLKSHEANYYLGAIAEEEGAPNQALKLYNRVEGEHFADAQVRIAKIHADKGDLKQARETLQRLRVNQNHNQLNFFMIEAELLRQAKEFNTANEVYSKALEMYKGNTDLLYARGLNAADMRRVDLLESDLRKILETQPQHADALNALGYTLADQTDRFDEAKTYIEKALLLKPNNPAILDSLGWVEYRMGNYDAALKHLKKAAEINPDAEIAAHLGEVLWIMGQQQRALDVWKEANLREPDNRFVKPAMQRLGAEN